MEHLNKAKNKRLRHLKLRLIADATGKYNRNYRYIAVDRHNKSLFYT